MKTLYLGLFLCLAGGAFAQPPPAVPDTDMHTVKERIRASLIPAQPEDRAELTRAAHAAMATQQPDGSWPDVVYANTERSGWLAPRHLDRLLHMAKAHAIAPDAALRDGLRRGLNFWLSGDYQNPNWWWNQIGVPQLIGEVLLLMDTHLTPDQRAKGGAILRRAVWKPGQGQNTVWMARITAVRGLLENDADAVAEGFRGVYGEIQVAVPPNEGIQADSSFHQHGPQFYSGGYGYAFGNDTALAAAFTWGTRFQIPAEKMRILSAYLLDGQQWMIRSPAFDYSAVGREITRPGKVALPRSWQGGPISPVGAAYALLNAVERLAALPVPHRSEFRAFGARLRVGRPPLSGHRHFWKSDYAAHHRAGYFVGVRMYSDRLFNTEVVNNEGKLSHHLADGAMLLYRDGTEYMDIFPVWDWRRVPGVTARETDPSTWPRNPQRKNGSAFVGGVTDGRDGVAAMHLVRDELEARKAWFFFDDEIVCLGADIHVRGDAPAATSVNQCLLRGDVTTDSSAAALPKGERALNGARWVLHDGVGYVFPANTAVRLQNDARTGRWSDIGTGSPDPVTRDVFGLWLPHAAGPEGARYQYTVVPGADASALRRRVQGGPVRVLQNGETLQAVWHAGKKQVQAVFWRAGALDAGPGRRITVDRPCLLLLSETRDGITLSVSNPENKALDVVVTLDRPLAGEGVSGVQGGSRVLFRLPDGDQAGASMTRRLMTQR